MNRDAIRSELEVEVIWRGEERNDGRMRAERASAANNKQLRFVELKKNLGIGLLRARHSAVKFPDVWQPVRVQMRVRVELEYSVYVAARRSATCLTALAQVQVFGKMISLLRKLHLHCCCSRDRFHSTWTAQASSTNRLLKLYHEEEKNFNFKTPSTVVCRFFFNGVVSCQRTWTKQ